MSENIKYTETSTSTINIVSDYEKLKQLSLSNELVLIPERENYKISTDTEPTKGSHNLVSWAGVLGQYDHILGDMKYDYTGIFIIPPKKTLYLLDEEVDYTGLEIYLEYSNAFGKILKKQVEIEDCKVETFISEDGTYEVQVSYTENNITQTGYFYYLKRDKFLTNIEVTNTPTIMEYTYDEEKEIDISGLVVTAYYTNGDSQQIYPTRVDTIIPSDSIGEHTVYIEYTEYYDGYASNGSLVSVIGSIETNTSFNIIINKKNILAPKINDIEFTYDNTLKKLKYDLYGYDKYISISGVTEATESGEYTTVFSSDPSRIRWWGGEGDATEFPTELSVTWKINKAPRVLTINENDLYWIRSIEDTQKVPLTYLGDGDIFQEIKEGTGTFIIEVKDKTLYIQSSESGTSILTVTVAEGTNYLATSLDITLNSLLEKVYGVEWTVGPDSSRWSRTDDAVNFSNPIPFKIGMLGSECSSPFDNILPWSGMEIVEDVDGILSGSYKNNDAGIFVKIPRFYYKWTRTNDEDGNLIKMKLQISESPIVGFETSPGHVRGGNERGISEIYVGKYLTNGVKSLSNSLPNLMDNIGIDQMREDIYENYYTKGTYCKVALMDYATYWTIMMLYLVEYADWNAQKVIGMGTNNLDVRQVTGLSDLMPYHTGVIQEDKFTKGIGVQYRYIESLWDNLSNFIEGIYVQGEKLGNKLVGRCYTIEQGYIYERSQLNEDAILLNDGDENYLFFNRGEGTIVSWTKPTTSNSRYNYAIFPIFNENSKEMNYVSDSYLSLTVFGEGGAYLATGGSAQNNDTYYDLHGPFHIILNPDENYTGYRLQIANEINYG